ncbi:LamG-like jellyroll fold domain-containing protein [Thermus sp.]|uniref:LamG-like jellyroll fold domain-containing protein n=1 Tax=Thermus sp. TaxID=275 RepID=UPI00307F7295
MAHWPLDELPGATSVAETVQNLTGIPKPGAVQSLFNPGGPWSVLGHMGKAFYFPGNGDSYVEVPSTPSLTPARFILTAWVAPVQCGMGAYYPVVDKWDPNTGTGYALYLEGVGPGQVRPVARLNGATFTGTTTFAANYDPNANTGTWTEVRLKVDGTLGAFFVNGTPAGTFTAPTGLSNTIPLWMGAMHQAPSGLYYCEIGLDEVRLDKIPGQWSGQ